MKPPSPSNFDSDEPVLLPGCAAARAALQNHLDGKNDPVPEAVLEHRSQCAECRALESAARLLFTVLPARPMIELAPGFADRVVAQFTASTDRPWLGRRWIRVTGFALAASLLVAVAGVIREDRQSGGPRGMVITVSPHVQVKHVNEIVREKPTPLQESFAEAGSAVAALTRKVTADGFGLKLPRWQRGKAGVDPLPNLDAGFTTLQEVRHNAGLSIAPITDSARRALDVFWRELGPEMESKPANN